MTMKKWNIQNLKFFIYHYIIQSNFTTHRLSQSTKFKRIVRTRNIFFQSRNKKPLRHQLSYSTNQTLPTHVEIFATNWFFSLFKVKESNFITVSEKKTFISVFMPNSFYNLFHSLFFNVYLSHYYLFFNTFVAL